MSRQWPPPASRQIRKFYGLPELAVNGTFVPLESALHRAARVLYSALRSFLVAGFDGLRVLSFESRRAKEIAQLIRTNGGVPTVAPSTREVPERPSDDELRMIRGIVEGRYDHVIFMTGVGARALLDVGRSIYPSGEFEAALARSKIIVRGPKRAAVLRESRVPFALAAPEPNTWREVIAILDENRERLPISGRRIAVQEHGEPSEELYQALRTRGAEVFPIRV